MHYMPVPCEQRSSRASPSEPGVASSHAKNKPWACSSASFTSCYSILYHIISYHIVLYYSILCYLISCYTIYIYI